MRSPRTLLLALLLAIVPLAAAGCGGSEVSADEVPGPPAALTVPSDTDLGGGGNSDDSSSNSDDSSSSDENSGSGADDTTGGTTTPDTGTTAPSTDDTSGGAAAPETGTTAPEDSAANDTPPAGSEAQQFESFCEQNAGAC